MASDSRRPSGWSIATLGDLGRIVTGKTPSTKVAGHFGGDVPFITPSDMDGRRVIATTERHLTEQGAASVAGARIPAGTVMISCIGSDMGKASIAGCDAVTNQQINSIVVREGISNLYVYYNLSTRKAELQHLASGGSAQPILNKGHFSQLEIELPSIKEQQAIACILGALDDKIELNRRMNRTLEGLTRAIFKSWFVDFNPVRAKAAGQTPPGLNRDLGALFPNSFGDSELGRIPRGWKISRIRDQSSRIQYGLTTSASDDPVGPKFLRITDIREGNVNWPSVPYCEATEADCEKYRVQDGDIVVARTGASTGDNLYLIDPPRSVFASYLVRFQFEEPGIARVVAEFMRSAEYKSFVKGSIGGSAQPNANAQTLSSASMPFPTSDIAAKFYQVVRPLDQKRAVNARQSESLAALRDALLPRLISGELRVPDADRIVQRTL